MGASPELRDARAGTRGASRGVAGCRRASRGAAGGHVAGGRRLQGATVRRRHSDPVQQRGLDQRVFRARASGPCPRRPRPQLLRGPRTAGLAACSCDASRDPRGSRGRPRVVVLPAAAQAHPPAAPQPSLCDGDVTRSPHARLRPHAPTRPGLGSQLKPDSPSAGSKAPRVNRSPSAKSCTFRNGFSIFFLCLCWSDFLK